MLLSQRIAKDPKFVNTAPGEPIPMFDLRVKIMNAPKFIVGPELLMVKPVHEVDMVLKIAQSKNKRDLDKNMLRWGEYVRMPFPQMVIEAPGGLVYIEQWEKDIIAARVIDDEGDLSPCYSLLVGGTKTGKHGEDIPTVIPYSRYPSPKYEEFIHRHVDPEKYYDSLALSVAIQLGEVFLFLNAANVVTHRYTPTKKENDMVPKPLQKKYVYHILDIYRTRTRYVALNDTDELLKVPLHAQIDRCATVVRGHWKTFIRQGEKKLFWWNYFIRNRKNRNTVGFIEKDYRLVSEEV